MSTLNKLWEYLAEKGVFFSETQEKIPEISKYNRRNDVYLSRGENPHTIRFWMTIKGKIFSSKEMGEDDDLKKLVKEKVFSKPPK